MDIGSEHKGHAMGGNFSCNPCIKGNWHAVVERTSTDLDLGPDSACSAAASSSRFIAPVLKLLGCCCCRNNWVSCMPPLNFTVVFLVKGLLEDLEYTSAAFGAQDKTQ